MHDEMCAFECSDTAETMAPPRHLRSIGSDGGQAKRKTRACKSVAAPRSTGVIEEKEFLLLLPVGRNKNKSANYTNPLLFLTCAHTQI